MDISYPGKDMKKTDFFFVNKTASSIANNTDHLTHSVGAQRSAIQRHVQNGLARPRGARRGKSRSKMAPFLLDDRSLYNPTLRNIACKLDAFNTASINLDATVQFLLHYYIFYYQWTIMTNEPLPRNRQPQAFRTSVVPIVHTALEDELIMHCLLTTAVCRVRYHDGRLQFPVSTEDHFMSEALRLLQKLIDAANSTKVVVSDRLVSSILFLGIAECFRRNYAASRTHLGALLDLLGPDGITQLQDKSMQEQLLLVDLVDSSIYLEPCRFSNNDPGPASVLSLTEHELLVPSEADYLGSALLAKRDTVLPSGLKDLVLQILETYDVKSRLNPLLLSESRGFEITYWVTKRNRAIWKNLLGFETRERKVQALKGAIIMWILLAMTLTARVRTVKEMAKNLQSLVDKVPAKEWCNDEDLRLWILLMGYHCAEDGSVTLIWFAEQIRRVQGLRKKIIGTIPMPGKDESLTEVFVRLQRRFLFHPAVQTARTVELTDWLMWWDNLVLL